MSLVLPASAADPGCSLPSLSTSPPDSSCKNKQQSSTVRETGIMGRHGDVILVLGVHCQPCPPARLTAAAAYLEQSSSSCDVESDLVPCTYELSTVTKQAPSKRTRPSKKANVVFVVLFLTHALRKYPHRTNKAHI